MSERPINPFPHEGGCPVCRAERRCNFCGATLIHVRKPRHGIVRTPGCTNGRCGNCHLDHCVTTTGGSGHGYGVRGAAHFPEASHR